MKDSNESLWENNHFNMKDENKERKIYHIVALDYFLSDWNKNKITFKSPFKWSDPFEGFYLKTTFVTKADNDTPQTIIKFGDSFKNVFGQSWSFVKDSNLMWDVYSGGNRMTLKVETTVSKLIEALKTNHNGSDRKIYFGKIKYLTRNDYLRMIQCKNPTKSIDQHNRDIYDTLFYKTIPYEYEKEFRILFYDKKLNASQEKYKLNFDWNEYIERIELSPNMNIEFIEYIKKLINSNIEIRKSELKNVEPMIINLE